MKFLNHARFFSTACSFCLMPLLAGVLAGQQPSSPAASPEAASNAARQLELGKTIAGEMRGGESQEYQFVLDGGKYAHVEIDQKSVDIAFAASGTDRQKVYEGNVTYPGELEKVSVISAIPGTYRIRVWPIDDTTPAGKYEITLTEIREASKVHRDSVAAEQAVAAGMNLYYQQKAEAKRNAIAKFTEALEHWRAAGDKAQESTTLSLMGNVYNDLGEKQKALDLINQALDLARANGDQAAEGWALEALGTVYENFGDKKRAVGLLEQALPLLRNTHHRYGEMRVLNGLGMSQFALGEKQKAMAYFQQAAEFCHQVNNLGGEASLLNNIAFSYSDLGEHGKALEMQNAALAIRRRINDRAGQGLVLNNIGASYSNLSEYQKAMDAYTEALNIARDLGQEHEEALRLNNLAWLYSTLGNEEKAIQYYTQSVALFRRIKDTWRLAHTLTNLGASYAVVHDYSKALEMYAESLPLQREGGDKNGIANTLNNAAFAYNKLGQREKALEYYREAVGILRTIHDQHLLMSTLHNLGALLRQTGDRRQAMEHLLESLELTRLIGDRRSQAEDLSTIARLELDQGELDSARRHCDESLAIFDSLRSTITNPSMRAWFSRATRLANEVNLQVLLQLNRAQPNAGHDAAAVAAVEKARARSLVELLGESQAKVREGVDPTLLDQEISLRRAIAAKAQTHERLLAGRHTEEEAAGSAKDLDTLTRQYDQLQSTIRKKSPAYSALTMPVTLTLADIQTKVLDEETLLLEYALGEEKSFLFAVTPHSLNVFELPKRDDIEAAVRHAYDLLTAQSHTVADETPRQRMLRLQRAQAEYPKAAAELSRILLGPAASSLGAKRLLIIAEGALQYIPFTALPEPRAKTAGPAQPLLVKHEVVTAPSASVLSLLREDAVQRPPAKKLLAILADPVFDGQDPRLMPHNNNNNRDAPRAGASAELVPAEVSRSAAEAGVQHFERLRFSRREAEQIARLVPGPQKFTALDFAANRPAALSPDISQYRIVHFATHGIINNQHPELSGLVLSLVNEKGEPVDGFMRLYDIYNLKLGADLVVLSACQTALGKEMAGEGLVGLTRGFVYAGAPRIVASLWRVEDRVTAEFMGSFYAAMLTRKERPAAALRAAQLAIKKSRGWESPYYWAAFTLQGEWK